MKSLICFRRRLDSQLQGAFTLLELLVVIAIIVILAALLMPTLAKIKASSSMAACASNLRQIGVVVQLNTADNDGRLPTIKQSQLALNAFLIDLFASTFPATGVLTKTSYGADIAHGPLVKSWICPGDPTRGGWVKLGATNGIPGEPNSDTSINAHSYCLNMLVNYRKMAEIAKPSQTILMTDFDWGGIGTRANWPYSSPWKDNLPTTWHDGKINCLFVDGHIEALKVETLIWGQSNSRLWYANYPSSGMNVIYP